MTPGLLHRVWAELQADPTALARVRVVGTTGLVSRLPVEELATATAAAHLLSGCELRASTLGVDRGRRDPVVVDAGHVGVEFASERHLRVDGVSRAGGFAELSRFWPTCDGWVRVHANYPHHRAALLRALSLDAERAGDVEDVVATALAERTAEEVEDAVVAAGGVAAAVRAPQEWAASPMGAAVAGAPLVDLTDVGAAAGRLVRADRDGHGAAGVAGARVLDLTRVIAGPTATRALAAWGADVLRIDPPSLPELTEQSLETGPGKRCAALDLATRDGETRLEELLAGADVLVHGYRPGALDRFGLDGPSLAARHPRLVVASLSAWGREGPWRGRRGFDSLVQAASGIAVMTGAADGRPGALPVQALDHAAGQLLAAAVMRALELRRCGGTWHAHTSLAGLARWLLASTMAAHDDPPLPPQTPATSADPYLVEVPSLAGRLTVVHPLGAPAWVAGPVPSEPTWLHDPGRPALAGLRRSPRVP